MRDLFLEQKVLDEPLTLTAQENFEDEFLSLRLKAKEVLSQVAWVLTHRKLEYLPLLFNLNKHESVQVRRKVAEAIGFLGKTNQIRLTKEWQLEEADRQVWLILESAVDRISRSELGQDLDQDIRILSVSEALSQIKRLLSEKNYTIEGEVSDIKPVRQMYYFAIKDKEEGRLDCWAFSGKIIQAGFPLNEGLQVRLTGKFKLSKSSRIYFDIEKIELTGQGELLRNLKLLEEKLENEGLFNPLRKRQPIQIPEKILLIASKSSAALRDFTKVLEERIGGRQIYLLPIKTQGVGAEFKILQKLDLANKLAEIYKIDTIVITRGGGSKDDLFVFNSEKIVRKIHGLNRPAIVAIGHEIDTTLAEKVADLRASTPSQAAELVCLSRSEILSQTRAISSYLQSYFFQKKQSYLLTSRQLSELVFRNVNLKIQKFRLATQRTDAYLSRLLSNIRLSTSQMVENLVFLFKQRLLLSRQNLPNLAHYRQNLLIKTAADGLASKNSYEKIISVSQTQLTGLKSQLAILNQKLMIEDPKKVLEKGYALVWQDQKVVEKKNNLKNKSAFTIQFKDGQVKIPRISDPSL